VTEIHRYVGFVVVAIFTIGCCSAWSCGSPAVRRGDWFWRWLVAAQVVAIVQALIGVILLIAGKRPTTTLHYVYGFGPLVVFAIGHLLAREEAFRTKPWAPFALASFISFGLACGRSPPAWASARGIVPPGPA
jgi:heme A synthase